MLAKAVIARWERAVRSQHTDVLSADNTLSEQKTVFGDFLSSNKKLPAGRRTAEALTYRYVNLQALRNKFVRRIIPLTRISNNHPCSPIIRSIRPNPINHHSEPIAKTNQKEDVRDQPKKPRHRS
jgi:hypothetical protein